MIVQRTVAGRHDLIPVDYVEKIKPIRGVQQVKGRLWGYYFEPGVQANYTLIVPDDFVYEPGSVVIGHGVSRTLGAGKDDLLPFGTYDGSYISLQTVLKKVEEESKNEWVNLLEGPLKNITEKQKRIPMDDVRKQERKALRTHKELFVDMLTIGEEEKLTHT